MLLMLIRTLLWGVVILAAAVAFDWLRDSTGGVSVDLNGRTYGPFAPLEFVGLVIAIAVLIWLHFKAFSFIVALVRFLSGDETALSRYWNRSRERRGFDALSEGLISLAEGDGDKALTRARKAERLLSRPGLTRLAMAQAAQASGDANLARIYYKQLASEPDTAFVGTKGLLAEALHKGETDRALKLAQHAFALRPKKSEVLTTLFGLQSQTEDWAGARETLGASVSAKTLPKDVAARREAVLLLAEARNTDDSGKKLSFTFAANKKSPGLVPAAADAAELHLKHGSDRRARRTLKDAWRLNPHPDLAAAFAKLAPDEDVGQRRKRFKELLDVQPEHTEARLLTGELALADHDFDGAKIAIGDLVESEPSTRSLSIMAAIEKGKGADDGVIRGWLAKAIAAPRGPQWICSNCGAVHADWVPTCNSCSAFDTLDWTAWKEPEDAIAKKLDMAPLLTDPSDDVEITVPVEEDPDIEAGGEVKPKD